MFNSQILEIAERLKELREIKGITTLQVSESLNISEEEYLEYESGKKDFSFSVMYRIANVLGVDIVSIISGSSPRLNCCSVVRRGKGMKVIKHDSEFYYHLAYTFTNKKAEPMLFTINPNDRAISLHSHKGQEFNYVLEGTLRFEIDDLTYELNAGDSVYFDSGIPHLEKCANDKPVVFLAVVIKD